MQCTVCCITNRSRRSSQLHYFAIRRSTIDVSSPATSHGAHPHPLVTYFNPRRFVRTSPQPRATVFSNGPQTQRKCLLLLRLARAQRSSPADSIHCPPCILRASCTSPTSMHQRMARRDASCPRGGIFYSCNKGFVGCCLVEACNPGVGCPADKDRTVDICESSRIYPRLRPRS